MLVITLIFISFIFFVSFNIEQIKLVVMFFDLSSIKMLSFICIILLFMSALICLMTLHILDNISILEM